MLVIGQLRHQSAIAPSRAIHLADAVAAHQCHELWSHKQVAERETKWHNSLHTDFFHSRFHSVSKYVKVLEIHQDFPVIIANVLQRF